MHLRKVEEVRSSCMSCLPQSKLASNMDMDFPVDHLCLCKWMSSLCGWFGAAGGFVWFVPYMSTFFIFVYMDKNMSKRTMLLCKMSMYCWAG